VDFELSKSDDGQEIIIATIRKDNKYTFGFEPIFKDKNDKSFEPYAYEVSEGIWKLYILLSECEVVLDKDREISYCKEGFFSKMKFSLNTDDYHKKYLIGK
jgi:hypothetical protein